MPAFYPPERREVARTATLRCGQSTHTSNPKVILATLVGWSEIVLGARFADLFLDYTMLDRSRFGHIIRLSQQFGWINQACRTGRLERSCEYTGCQSHVVFVQGVLT